MKKKLLATKLISSLFLAATFLLVHLGEASETFPVYPNIEPNFRFWVDMYSKYPTTKGIVHDSIDLAIIYEVIDLWSPDRRGAKKVNDKRIKLAREKYKKILEKLAQHAASQDPDVIRVANLFGPNAVPATFRKAMHNIRCQSGQKDRFQDGLIRSGAYLDDIKRIFVSRGLPEDLAYLPHVESSFNLKAYSKFGAAGIWQFTRSTGKRFLTVNHALDERRDPIRSSEAAASLLEENYKKLGSWPLAITAYNHGILGVLRAKKTKGGYEEAFESYKSSRFRFASRNFYPEFLAARHVALNYERYFGAIELDKPLETREVRMEGHAPVTKLSNSFEVDIHTLRMLNPALRQPIFNGQKYVPEGYALRLPSDGPGILSTE